jgi:glycosyltransferase involved in cell wall biosynthesis
LLPETLDTLQKNNINQTYHLLCVGPDEDGTLKAITSKFNSLGLGRQVHTLPTQSEAVLRGIYSAADAFLLPSLHENFGNVAVEGIACGCPGIVSKETACIEFAAGMGLTAAQNRSASTWAGAIRGVLAVPRTQATNREQLLARMGLVATATAMAKFYESL